MTILPILYGPSLTRKMFGCCPGQKTSGTWLPSDSMVDELWHSVEAVRASDDDYETTTLMNNKKAGFTAPAAFLQELRGDKEFDPFGDRKIPRIVDREDEYRAQRRKFMISPERLDPFADG
ncbi:UNVERIFIED_CONTAM: sf3b1 [Trichonephila clavipes]